MTARRDGVRPLLAPLFALLAVLLVAGVAPAAARQTTDPAPAPSTTLVEGGDLPGIIPRPNSGQAPTRPGERGGWAQLLLAGLLVVAVTGIFVVVARSVARTTRAKQQRVD